LVQEIAAASKEQSIGVEQINSAMSQLNQATQQNASASEELAATAEEMGAQSEQLQQLMTFFRLQQSGASSAEAPTIQPTARSVTQPQSESRLRTRLMKKTKSEPSGLSFA
jgi:methyl-accepting chemotaxis protein